MYIICIHTHTYTHTHTTTQNHMHIHTCSQQMGPEGLLKAFLSQGKDIKSVHDARIFCQAIAQNSDQEWLLLSLVKDRGCMLLGSILDSQRFVLTCDGKVPLAAGCPMREVSSDV